MLARPSGSQRAGCSTGRCASHGRGGAGRWACTAGNTASLSAEPVLWLTVPCILQLPKLQPRMQDDDWLFTGMALALHILLHSMRCQLPPVHTLRTVGASVWGKAAATLSLLCVSCRSVWCWRVLTSTTTCLAAWCTQRATSCSIWESKSCRYVGRGRAA